mmetsp:Transcript_4084/g.14562  ORF Transcript_4084/g.14562 Transcript_4084/m.14562 type:complete len:118 (-) Transcript_4084:1005-1358(-)
MSRRQGGGCVDETSTRCPSSFLAAGDRAASGRMEGKQAHSRKWVFFHCRKQNERLWVHGQMARKVSRPFISNPTCDQVATAVTSSVPIQSLLEVTTSPQTCSSSLVSRQQVGCKPDS